MKQRPMSSNTNVVMVFATCRGCGDGACVFVALSTEELLYYLRFWAPKLSPTFRESTYHVFAYFLYALLVEPSRSSVSRKTVFLSITTSLAWLVL
eukprot:g70719.t1